MNIHRVRADAAEAFMHMYRPDNPTPSPRDYAAIFSRNGAVIGVEPARDNHTVTVADLMSAAGPTNKELARATDDGMAS